MNEDDLKNQIRQLFALQQFAVIATERNRQPYTHLVAFTSTPDLRSIVFATKRDTQKYLNIRENQHVAVLIDNRQNTPTDLSEAMTVNAQGIAKEIKDKNGGYRRLFLKKHPDLSSFFDDPTCALIEVHVMTYQVVQKFENVHVFKITDERK